MRALIIILLMFASVVCLSQPRDSTLMIDTSGNAPLLIDTGTTPSIDTTRIDTATQLDSSLIIRDSALSNTQLFIYIILTFLGGGLLFFIFVNAMFKTFHKTRSTRQALMLSWSLFFITFIVWIFIIWGLVAEMWSSAAFMVSLIFLFIVGLILTIVAVRSK